MGWIGRRAVRLGATLVVAAVCIAGWRAGATDDRSGGDGLGGTRSHGRDLLAIKTSFNESSCATGIDANASGPVIYLGVLAYLFLGLAVICESRFKDSLVAIAAKSGLPDDVVGATFMAAGTSSPELFMSLAALFAPKDDIGAGTIVGSAIFNLLVIVGGSVIFSKGGAITVPWRPLLRDVLLNVIAFVYMFLVFLDSEIHWWEAGLALALYGAYVAFMAFQDTAARKVPIFRLCVSAARLHGAGDAEDGEGLLDGSLADDGFEEELFVSELDADDGGPIRNSRSMLELASMRRRASGLVSDASLDDVPADYSPYDDPHFEGDDPETYGEGEGAATAAAALASSLHKALGAEPGGGTLAPDAVRAAQAGDLAGPHHSKSLVDRGGVGDGFLRPLSSPPGGDGEGFAMISGEDSFAGSNERSARRHESHRADTGAPVSDDGEGHSSVLARAFHVVSWPLDLLFRYTIPPSDSEQHPWVCVVAFTLSLVWLAAICYAMSFCASKLGCIYGIDPEVMGISLLAVGTSLPDCLASIYVARDGQGPMAVANALGSTTFDILIGLGLPWFLSAAIGDPVTVSNKDIEIYSGAFAIALVVFICTVAAGRWRLDRRSGSFLIALYVVFLSLSILRTMGLL